MFEANKAVFTNFLYVALAFVLLEMLFARRTKQPLMSFKDTSCNLITMVIGRLTQPLFAGYIYFTLTGLEKMMPFHLPQTTQTTIAAIILTDFVYYWQHRLSHTQRWLWFFHEVHHSSKYFNFTTSFRLAWLGRLVAPLFFAPLVILGFSAEQVTLFFILNLFYQFFLHTQLVGKLPLVEGILNTPSAHRVHHARNKEYLNKNFGGIFMLWDRFYGTYEPEVASPKFGIIGRFESYNPFTVQFHKIPGYSKFAAVCARMLSSARTKAVVLAAFIIPSMAAAPTVAQTIERKPLEGKIEVSDTAALLGTWNAEVHFLNRHPKVVIESIGEDNSLRGTYNGRLGSFPLTGQLDPETGLVVLRVDFKPSLLGKLRPLKRKSLVAEMRGKFAQGQLSGTASLPDVSAKLVSWEARKSGGP